MARLPDRLLKSGRWLAIAIIVFSSMILALRLGVPHVPGLKVRVEQEISRVSGHEVRIGQLALRWRILSLDVSISDLRIHAGGVSEPELQIGRLDMNLPVFQSLRHRQLVVRNVLLRGADLHLFRDEAGRFQVHGAPTAHESWRLTLPEALRLVAGSRFALTGTRLRWEDRILGIDYQFEDIALKLALGRDRLRVDGEVYLPGELGHAMTVGVDISHDGDGGDWTGVTYLRTHDLQLDSLPEHLQELTGIDDGVLDSSVWIRWQQGDVRRVHAVFDAAQVGFPVQGADGSGIRDGLFESLGGQVQWLRLEDGWRLLGRDLRVQREGHAWPAAAFDVHLSKDAGQGRRLMASVNYLRLDELTALLGHGAIAELPWRDRLSAMRPRGLVRDLVLELQLPAEGTPGISAQGSFAELGMDAVDRLPGLRGLEGSFRLEGDEGEVWLDSRNMRLDLPAWFDDSLFVERLEGLLELRQSDGRILLSSDGLAVRNADVAGTVRGSLDLGPDPFLDLMAEFGPADALAVHRYLPRRIMPPRTVNWLDNAIQAGRIQGGDLILRGPLRDFPFRSGGGHFRVRSQIADGLLEYQPDWPPARDIQAELVFENQGMHVLQARGELLSAALTDVEVRIGDLQSAVVEITGLADGDLDDFKSFVLSSPLGDTVDSWLAPMVLGGQTRLDLSLILADREQQAGRDQFRGSLTVKDAFMEMPEQELRFDAISGTTQFTQDSLQARAIVARLNDQLLRVQADRMPSGDLSLRASGRQSIRRLFGFLPDSLLQSFDGASDWRARLEFPARSPAYLELESDLQGVESLLPAPLSKPAALPRPIHLRWMIDADIRERLHLRLGEDFKAVMGWRAGGDGLRAGLQLGDSGLAQLPDRGLRIAGTSPELDADAWLAWLDHQTRQQGMAVPAGVDMGIDLSVGRLDLGGRTIRGARLHSAREGDAARLFLEAGAVTAELYVPARATSDRPVTLRAPLLNLDEMPAQADERDVPPPPDPRRLMPLDVRVDRLILGGGEYHSLGFRSVPRADGLDVIDGFVQSPRGNLKLSFSGDWTVSAANGQQTRLAVDLRGDDLGEGLSDLNQSHNLVGGVLSLGADLHWPDALTRFDLGTVEGQGDFRLEDGRFKDVDAGAGRWFGLFSIDMLPRRLALDFRDVFQRGLAFDELQGSFTLAQGSMYTRDLNILSPAARIRISGRTGLVARDHDQTIEVTPNMTSTLPLAGTLLAGPVAGLAVFLVDRVAGLGSRIDNSMQLEYRVTGPWGDPEVSTVVRGTSLGLP